MQTNQKIDILTSIRGRFHQTFYAKQKMRRVKNAFQFHQHNFKHWKHVFLCVRFVHCLPYLFTFFQIMSDHQNMLLILCINANVDEIDPMLQKMISNHLTFFIFGSDRERFICVRRQSLKADYRPPICPVSDHLVKLLPHYFQFVKLNLTFTYIYYH